MAGYQKKSSKNARLIALGFAAFILIYLFGQLWGFANLKLRTEQVDEDTIYDFVRAQGTVFRSEQLIEPVSASGVMVYNCADGDEVAMSEEVAAVYSDSTVSTVNNQLEQLQHELDSLTKAQTAKATRYTAVSNLSSEINDQAGKIVDFVQDGVVEGISDQKDELVSLLNRKKIALGQEESFEGRITELTVKLRNATIVEAPKAGKVGNGSLVTLELAGREMTYALGSRDIKVATKYDVISPESPIGAAILGANEGDTVSYKAPNGREISVVIKEAKPLS